MMQNSMITINVPMVLRDAQLPSKFGGVYITRYRQDVSVDKSAQPGDRIFFTVNGHVEAFGRLWLIEGPGISSIRGEVSDEQNINCFKYHWVGEETPSVRIPLRALGINIAAKIPYELFLDYEDADRIHSVKWKLMPNRKGIYTTINGRRIMLGRFILKHDRPIYHKYSWLDARKQSLTFKRNTK